MFNIGIDPNLNDQLLTKKLYVYDSCPDNNTISEDRLARNLEVLGRKHSDELHVKFAGYEYIINNSDTLKSEKELDLLSIDIEGIEYEVIKSIICEIKILPNVICIEQLSMDCKRVLESEIYKLLSDSGYTLISKTILSSIYVHEKFIKVSNSPYFDTRLRSKKN